MSNTYRALSKPAQAVYSDGVFEHDFTPTDEQDALNSGLLELVPRTYKVLSNNFAAGEQGDEIQGAYLVEIEQALISGGHIERVDRPASKGGSTKKTAAAAADEKKED
jgi:hypothetical protein